MIVSCEVTIMSSVLIRNGYIVDPDTKFEGVADLLIKDGVIDQIGPSLDVTCDVVIPAEGLTVMPGLVDLHVHLRDPGQTHKETVHTAARAAAHGGVTSLLAMPNTNPPMDSARHISYVLEKAKTESPVHIYQTCSLTKDMKGEELVDFDEVVSAGTLAFSEDGKSVMNGYLMREAMREAVRHDALICEHSEDITMVRGGVMNDDDNARRLGLPGIGNEVEDTICARDIVLAKATGARLHFCHVSTEGSVRLIAFAKAEGAPVTGEVCPHHFTLTSDDIPGDDANFKMNPPLRTKKDVEALRRGLQDGTIDCISTDHAPHSEEEKKRGFLSSPFGITGLETSAALTYTELVKPGVLTLMQMAEKMCLNPARILRIPAGSLKEGMPADIAVFDFRKSYTIDPSRFESKGKNTPFAGREVYGSCEYTFVGGRLIWGEIQ
jgi:dihydroorotase